MGPRKPAGAMKLRIFAVLFVFLCLPAVADNAAAQGGDRGVDFWTVEALVKSDGENARQMLRTLASHRPRNELEAAAQARVLALGALRYRDDSLARAADNRLIPLRGWLSDYGKMMSPVGEEEPAWLRSQSGTVAEALVAWCLLEKYQSDPVRREALTKFAEGLLLYKHKHPHLYPFRAHTSLGQNNVGYVSTPDGELAPGAYVPIDHARQVQALALVSQVTGIPDYLAGAEREGLGLMSHLVTSGKLVKGFAPRPEENGGLAEAAVIVDNFLALHEATGKRPYAVMAGLAAKWAREARASQGSGAQSQAILDSVKGTPAEFYSRASDVGRPSTFQVMDAEDGKAVQKAIEGIPLTYPGGTTGNTVTVGRENMFWMRFDVDREDDYYFYMVFLKSKIDGGLVSVMMRIDGDKIFQVNLGGAQGKPRMAMDLVEGPRHLRSGPHSFGIRFSGLLMTQPAVLDAVVVQPVIERRTLNLPDGRRLVVLNNLAPDWARTTYDDIRPWAQAKIETLDGDGLPAQLNYESDRRRRKDYLKMPAGGLTLIEWTPAAERPEIE